MTLYDTEGKRIVRVHVHRIVQALWRCTYNECSWYLEDTQNRYRAVIIVRPTYVALELTALVTLFLVEPLPIILAPCGEFSSSHI